MAGASLAHNRVAQSHRGQHPMVTAPGAPELDHALRLDGIEVFEGAGETLLRADPCGERALRF